MQNITSQQDFEGRKHIAMMRDTEVTRIASYTAENFTYSVYRQPAFDVVHFDPLLDFEMPEHYLVHIRLGNKNVVQLRTATIELAKKEIADRILGMLDMAFY